MTARQFELAHGDVGWAFPTLTSAAEQVRVRRLLVAADDALYQVGRQLGARPDARASGLPLNRLIYQRLGPEPAFPVTVLLGEGGSDEIFIEILCAPVGGPYHQPGPPWQVSAWISLVCDVDPRRCAGHQIDARLGPIVDTPTEAASEIRAACQWLAQCVSHETTRSLRARDQKAGHASISSHD